MRNMSLYWKISLVLPLVSIGYVLALLLATQPAGAYLTGEKWFKTTIYWDSVFKYNTASAPFPPTTRGHINGGAYQWDDANTGAKFYIETCSGCNEDVWVTRLSFSANQFENNPGEHRRYVRSDGLIYYGTTYLNSDWRWNDQYDGSCNVNRSTQTADVRIVINHEEGHWMRLRHDENHREAVMWPDNTCKLTTTADDDNGVKALYGAK